MATASNAAWWTPADLWYAWKVLCSALGPASPEALAAYRMYCEAQPDPLKRGN